MLTAAHSLQRSVRQKWALSCTQNEHSAPDRVRCNWHSEQLLQAVVSLSSSSHDREGRGHLFRKLPSHFSHPKHMWEPPAPPAGSKPFPTRSANPKHPPCRALNTHPMESPRTPQSPPGSPQDTHTAESPQLSGHPHRTAPELRHPAFPSSPGDPGLTLPAAPYLYATPSGVPGLSHPAKLYRRPRPPGHVCTEPSRGRSRPQLPRRLPPRRRGPGQCPLTRTAAGDDTFVHTISRGAALPSCCRRRRTLCSRRSPRMSGRARGAPVAGTSRPCGPAPPISRRGDTPTAAAATAAAAAAARTMDRARRDGTRPFGTRPLREPRPQPVRAPLCGAGG